MRCQSWSIYVCMRKFSWSAYLLNGMYCVIYEDQSIVFLYFISNGCLHFLFNACVEGSTTLSPSSFCLLNAYKYTYNAFACWFVWHKSEQIGINRTVNAINANRILYQCTFPPPPPPPLPLSDICREVKGLFKDTLGIVLEIDSCFADILLIVLENDFIIGIFDNNTMKQTIHHTTQLVYIILFILCRWCLMKALLSE